MEKKNITLIGMPGAGKSVVGELLAERLGLKFLDTDIEVKGADRLYLQDKLDEMGDEEFLKHEAETVCRMVEGRQGYVFAPGGSIVYSPEAMSTLKETSRVVYLATDLATIEKRIDLSSRGIVGLKGKSLEDLYLQREALYKKYADFMVITAKNSPAEVVNEIMNLPL